MTEKIDYSERVASLMFHSNISREKAATQIAKTDGVSRLDVLESLPPLPPAPLTQRMNEWDWHRLYLLVHENRMAKQHLLSHVEKPMVKDSVRRELQELEEIEGKVQKRWHFERDRTSGALPVVVPETTEEYRSALDVGSWMVLHTDWDTLEEAIKYSEIEKSEYPHHKCWVERRIVSDWEKVMEVNA